MTDSSIRKLTIYFSLVAFLVSLTLPTYCVNGECNGYGNGLWCLLTGWLGVILGGAYIVWLANPLIILSWIIIEDTLASIIVSGAALTLSLAFLWFDKIMINEAGHYGSIDGYQSGYWLWIISSGIVVTGNLIIIILNRPTEDGKRLLNE